MKRETNLGAVALRIRAIKDSDYFNVNLLYLVVFFFNATASYFYTSKDSSKCIYSKSHNNINHLQFFTIETDEVKAKNPLMYKTKGEYLFIKQMLHLVIIFLYTKKTMDNYKIKFFYNTLILFSIISLI